MDKSLLLEKWKQLSLMFVFGVFGGCIYFNLLWRFQGSLFQNEWGMIFDRILNCSIKEFYAQIMKYAIWILALQFMIFVLGFMKIGKILFQGMVVCSGFLTGAAETLLLLGFHLKEGGIFLGKFLLVFLVHILILGILLTLATAMSFLKWHSAEKTKKWKGIQTKKYLFWTSWTFILHIVYILILSYVNYGKIYLKIF